MEKIISLFLSIVLALIGSGWINSPLTNRSASTQNGYPEQELPIKNEAAQTINIQIGDVSFTAVLRKNTATQTLLEKLPLTLTMDELNGNEKYYFFADGLPASSERVEMIKAGDLMLYGSDCLVLFYEDLATSHSYTRLGCIEDTRGLADALGNRSIQVTFSIL